MGASASVDLRPEDVRELEDISAFEPKEIKSLYKRFRRLDRSGRGTISTDDLLMIPELSMNPLATRIISVFERDAEERINFQSFVVGLSLFAKQGGQLEQRQQVAFKMFDIDGDGVISEDDVRKLVDMMVGSTIPQHQIDLIVSQTMSVALASSDTPVEGTKAGITFEVFAQSMESAPWDVLRLPLKSTAWNV